MEVQDDPSVLGQHISCDKADGRVLEGAALWFFEPDPSLQTVAWNHMFDRDTAYEAGRPLPGGLNHLVIGHPDPEAVDRQGTATGIVDFRFLDELHEAAAQE